VQSEVGHGSRLTIHLPREGKGKYPKTQ